MKELIIKFENKLGITPNEIIRRDPDNLLYVSNADNYQVQARYNEELDLIFGYIYMSLGDPTSPKLMGEFKFLNTRDGLFDFNLGENNVDTLWIENEKDFEAIRSLDKDDFVRGKILEIFPIYVKINDENGFFYLSTSGDPSLRIDMFLDEILD